MLLGSQTSAPYIFQNFVIEKHSVIYILMPSSLACYGGMGRTAELPYVYHELSFIIHIKTLLFMSNAN